MSAPDAVDGAHSAASPGPAGLDDSALARVARVSSGGEARDHPALASGGLSSLLVLEIAEGAGRPKIDRDLRDLIGRMCLRASCVAPPGFRAS
jgi:hypothetical protein